MPKKTPAVYKSKTGNITLRLQVTLKYGQGKRARGLSLARKMGCGREK